MKKRGSNKLGNPAAVVAVTDYAAKNPKVVSKAVNVGLILLGVGILAGGYMYYKYFFSNTFKKIAFDKNNAPSNISTVQAQLRADKIYKAMKGFGNGYNEVYQALKGTNRNGFIAIYNAFGKRKPATDVLGIGNRKDMSLTEWFADQFSSSELEKLRFLIDGGGSGLFGCIND
ncbi:hypothetical protein ACI760_01320 [Capnocytophaga canimorsus]|uniref:hypothetical protein n=1 Tax=Capnocytophaga canimorsus TaxID=28188 RepID=UPI00385E01FA